MLVVRYAADNLAKSSAVAKGNDSHFENRAERTVMEHEMMPRLAFVRRLWSRRGSWCCRCSFQYQRVATTRVLEDPLQLNC